MVYANCFLYGYQRVEAEWQTTKTGTERVFKLEEVIDPLNRRSPSAGRFLHAIRDTKSKLFTHLDGALLGYSSTDRERRVSCGVTIKNAPKAESKPKLFRIDGEIPTESFEEISTLFMDQNGLVLEYFLGRGTPEPTTHT